MTWVIILLISFVFISILAFIINSRRTHKKHLEHLQEELKTTKKQKTSQRKKPRVENRPIIRPEVKKTKVEPVKPTPKVEVQPKVEPLIKAEAKVKVKTEKDYSKYNNARAVEQLGLSQEEADMFISELIEQIDSEIPSLEAAINSEDYEKIESISHMIKGSATSLGSGGVADVLVDFNTYSKEGKDIQVLQSHLANLKHHLVDLKAQFG
ncbi:MAG: hypothetical protein DRG24_07655 [Epsilonproteobacteria bacterium]|nr:MAG: hypothetical protein DRG24_07655 [Campylobacterota bacterium]